MSSTEAVREQLQARVTDEADRLAVQALSCLDALASLPGSEEAVGEMLVAARLLCFERGVDTGDVAYPVVSFGGTPVDHASPLTEEAERLEPGPVRDALEGLALLHAAVLSAADVQEYIDALHTSRTYVMASAFVERAGRALLRA